MTKKNNKNEDLVLNEVLRPKLWDEFIGQEKLKNQINLILEASKKRNEACDHFLFYGPSGLGKTTLAYVISNRLGANLKITSGPSIEKAGDLAAILTNLEDGDVLFIDEIHRLPRQIEEVIYPALESNVLNLVLGKGAGARTVQLKLPKFTLISATTRLGMISLPLRNRFGGVFQVDFYNEKDIEKIIDRSAKILDTKIEPEAIKILAMASRSTPRVANRLLKRSRDFSQVKNRNIITQEIAQDTLKLLETDTIGLEKGDRRLLEAIFRNFSGGPAGLKSLAAVTGEEEDTIEDVYEPFLMRIGFIERTSKGRKITPKGIEYLAGKKQLSL